MANTASRAPNLVPSPPEFQQGHASQPPLQVNKAIIDLTHEIWGRFMCTFCRPGLVKLPCLNFHTLAICWLEGNAQGDFGFESHMVKVAGLPAAWILE